MQQAKQAELTELQLVDANGISYISKYPYRWS